MDHAPFIWAAYGAGIVILAWCALAPVLRGRAFIARLRASEEHSRHAPDA